MLIYGLLFLGHQHKLSSWYWGFISSIICDAGDDWFKKESRLHCHVVYAWCICMHMCSVNTHEWPLLSANHPCFVLRNLRFESLPKDQVTWKLFLGFSQAVQANASIVPKIRSQVHLVACSLIRRLGGLQSHSWCFGEEKILYFCRALIPEFFNKWLYWLHYPGSRPI